MANIKNNTGIMDEFILNVIYGYYTKYENLIPIINNTFKGSSATTINIFIDFRDIMRKVDNYIKSNNSIINNKLVVTAGVINMVAHYRYFFSSRYRCHSKFWIINSFSNILASQHYKEFTIPQISSYSLYETNLQLLPILCNYINDVQFENCSVDVVTKAINILKTENKKQANPSILISKDPFVLQFCMMPDCYVLKPKKNASGDVSVLLNHDTAVYQYIDEISSINVKNILLPNVSQLSLLMALTKVPTRSLKTLYRVDSAVKKLNNAYKDGATMGYPFDIDTFMKLFCNINKINNPYEIICRFKACDTTVLQSIGYETMADSKLYNGIVNLYDPKAIQEINNTYFSSCPLDLNVL